MTETIDARGLECPEPAIRTGKALKNNDAITVIVDDAASVQNISGAVMKRGFQVQVEEKEGDFLLHITRKEGASAVGEETSAVRGEASAVRVGDSALQGGEKADIPGALQGETVVFLASNLVGRGDDELGWVLTKAMIYSLTQVEPKPGTMILMNSGVKLAVEGSEVLDDLDLLVNSGTKLLVCGTCLDFLGIKNGLAVGEVSNAYTIAETLLEAGKVIRL